MSKAKPQYVVYWTKAGTSSSEAYPFGYNAPGERDAAKSKAEAHVARLLEDGGVSGVTLELHEPSHLHDRYDVETLYRQPKR